MNRTELIETLKPSLHDKETYLTIPEIQKQLPQKVALSKIEKCLIAENFNAKRDHNYNIAYGVKIQPQLSINPQQTVNVYCPQNQSVHAPEWLLKGISLGLGFSIILNVILLLIVKL